jgi:hypothetical protein
MKKDKEEQKIETKKEEDEKQYVIAVCEDLMDILNEIKSRVKEFTWGAESNLSNFKASKILANRIKNSKLY